MRPAKEGSVGERLRRPRVRITPRAAILTIVLTALLLYLVVPLRAYLAQRDRLEQLTRRTQALEQGNGELRREIERLEDPRYLERLARECLGMVRPGEIAFVVVPASGRTAPADC